MKPFKFSEILKTTIWGGKDIVAMKGLDDNRPDIGESWEISGVAGAETQVADGDDVGATLAELIGKYREDFLGKENYQRYGTTFPLLIKFISTSRPLSVQVHPNDEMAHRMGHPYGKTEMWYVVDAAPGAELYLGFNHDFTKEGLVSSLQNGTLADHLALHHTAPGDCFFIPAGRIHNIGAGNLVIEIQQNSNDTFRVYDFDRVDASGHKRPLHVAQACEALNYKEACDSRRNYEAASNQPVVLVDCPEFTTRLLQIAKEVTIDYEELDSFVVYVAYEGAAVLEDSEGHQIELVKGQTVLFPAQNKLVKIFPKADSRFACLETYIK